MSSQEHGRRPNEASPLSLLLDVADSRKEAITGTTNRDIQTSRSDQAQKIEDDAVHTEEPFAQKRSLLSLLEGAGLTDPALLQQQAVAQEAAAHQEEQAAAHAFASERNMRAGLAAQLRLATQGQSHSLMLARALTQQNQQQPTQNQYQDLLLARRMRAFAEQQQQNQLGYRSELEDEAALALAAEMDMRSSLAAQLRQTAQNQDLLIARALAQQQLGIGCFGMDHLQDLHQAQQLEELQRHQLLVSSITGRSQLSRQQLQDAWSLQSKSDAFQRAPAAADGRAPVAADGLSNSHGNDLVDNGKKGQKPPGSVVVPCRARSMPVDHNFKTAYFVIPESAQHGEELICSYYACRNTGIKFRYCAYCNVPVAKRNFRKRHQHGKDADADGESHSGDDSASLSRSSVDREKNKIVDEPPTRKATAKTDTKTVTKYEAEEMSLDKDATGSEEAKQVCTPVSAEEKRYSSLSNPEERRNNQGDESDEVDGSRRSSLNSSSVESNNRMVMTGSDSSSKRSPVSLRTIDVDHSGQQPTVALGTDDVDRVTRWAALLMKRPQSDDNNAMQSWLLEVLSVSDLGPAFKAKRDNDREKDKVDGVAKGQEAPKSKGSLLTKKRLHARGAVEENVSSSRPEGAGSTEWNGSKKYRGLADRGYEL